MHEEINSLHTNKTWILVPKSPGINLVGSKWVFQTKLKAGGIVDRYKAGLMAREFSYLERIDFEEKFSHVVKTTTIRVVLSIAIRSKWEVRQLDVKNVFLHGFATRGGLHESTSWIY